MSRRVSTTKLAFTAALAILIAWLGLEPRVSVQRFTTLERLYQTGQLRHLEQDEQENFRSRIAAAVAAAGITAPLTIDAAPEHGHLHFYVTDPALSWFTNCGRGNAVYDSDLDAVFLDRSLWQPMELPKIGQSRPFLQESGSFGFSRTFIDFILLHELGHRALHRSRRSLFDAASSDKGRREETEADSFAIDAMGVGYVKGLFGRDQDTVDELTEIGIDPHLEARQRSVVALLYSAAQMSVGLLFSRGSFSSMYTDQSHPSFGQRVEHMLQVVSEVSRKDPHLQPYLEYFQAVAIRMEQVRQRHFVEIDAESPFEAAQFDQSGLTIVDTSWKVWHVDSSDFRKSRHVNSIAPQFVGTAPIGDPSVYVASIWSTPTEGVFVRSFPGEVFQINGGRIVARPDLSGTTGPRSMPIVLPAIQPSTTTIHTDGSSLLATVLGQAAYRLRQSDILSVTRNASVAYDTSILDSTLTGDVLHIPIYTHLGPVAGCVELTVSRPASMRFVKFALNDDVDGYGKLISVQDLNTTRHFIVGKMVSKVAVWELFANRNPLLRAIHATFASGLSSAASPLLHNQIEPYVTKVRLLPPQIILMALVGDSVYEFDVRSSDINVAFHPATSVNILLGDRGLLGFYAVNGYKAYVAVQP